jgi:hypothetical protein
MLDEVAPVEAPRGSVGTPLGRDFATDRADRAAQVNAQAQTGLENVDTLAAQGELQRLGGRAAQRMQDFEANAAARQGFGNLANTEQGIEAARQARINAPVDVPPVRGEPACCAVQCKGQSLILSQRKQRRYANNKPSKELTLT